MEREEEDEGVEGDAMSLDNTPVHTLETQEEEEGEVTLVQRISPDQEEAPGYLCSIYIYCRFKTETRIIFSSHP